MFSLVDSLSESDFHLLVEVIASLTLCMSSSPFPISSCATYRSYNLSVNSTKSPGEMLSIMEKHVQALNSTMYFPEIRKSLIMI